MEADVPEVGPAHRPIKTSMEGGREKGPILDPRGARKDVLTPFKWEAVFKKVENVWNGLLGSG